MTELMEQLVDTPAETLERRMRETAIEDLKLGEEYERWVRLILKSGFAADGEPD